MRQTAPADDSAALRAQTERSRAANVQLPDTHDYSEAQTRTLAED